MTRVGVISDTHGRLRPEIFPHLDGVNHILHAGDIGDLDILDTLAAVAPLTAVYGNTDDFGMRRLVPETARLDAEDLRIFVVHGHQLGSPTPMLLDRAYPEGDVIVFGHTHRPLVERIGERLFLNPGSAGPQRFRLKPSIAILELSAGRANTRLIEL